jgi:hypothetical protein
MVTVVMARILVGIDHAPHQAVPSSSVPEPRFLILAYRIGLRILLILIVALIEKKHIVTTMREHYEQVRAWD